MVSRSPGWGELDERCPNYCLRLYGSFTATHEGVLQIVYIRPGACAATGDCHALLADVFSSENVPDSTPPAYPDGKFMPDGLHVAEGQRVELTVLISFAAAPHPTTPPSH
jgi:hypothetical protein